MRRQHLHEAAGGEIRAHQRLERVGEAAPAAAQPATLAALPDARAVIAAVDAIDRARVVPRGYARNRMEGNGDALRQVRGTDAHALRRDGAARRVDGFAFRMAAQRGKAWVRDTPGR
jgi:hypothetical protein